MNKDLKITITLKQMEDGSYIGCLPENLRIIDSFEGIYLRYKELSQPEIKYNEEKIKEME